MKSIILALSFASLAMAQRPSYAGSSDKGYPGLASRFQDTQSTSNPSPDATDVPIVNRLGEGDSNSSSNVVPIPTDARGNEKLVNRFNQWPRENRPFWLINSQHIEKQRHPENINEALANRNVQNGQGGIQNRQGQALGSRGSFADETIPVRPAEARSSFLAPRE